MKVRIDLHRHSKNLVNKRGTGASRSWVGALCAATVMLAGSAHAACLATGTLQTARVFHERHYGFYAARQAGIRQAVTPGLLKLLEKEWACVAAKQVCAVDADPWLAAQDGDARDASFVVARDGRTVAVHYTLVLDAETRRPQTAQLRLARGGDGCWGVADLIGPEGRSLRQTLVDYYKRPQASAPGTKG